MKNVGRVDSILRIVLALVALGLYFGEILSGVWGLLAVALASILLITGLLKFCPLYSLFGLNTHHKKM